MKRCKQTIRVKSCKQTIRNVALNVDLNVNGGEDQVQIMEHFDEFNEKTRSDSLQAAYSTMEDRLKLACKHGLGRFNDLVLRIVPRTLPDQAKQA